LLRAREHRPHGCAFACQQCRQFCAQRIDPRRYVRPIFRHAGLSTQEGRLRGEKGVDHEMRRSHVPRAQRGNRDLLTVSQCHAGEERIGREGGTRRRARRLRSPGNGDDEYEGERQQDGSPS